MRQEYKPERILAIRNAGLGDMILTLSSIAPIKRNFKDSEIYMLSRGPITDFLNSFPFITGTIEYRKGLKGTISMISDIRKLSIDTIINFERAINKSIISLFFGATRRIGFNSIELAPFLTDRVPDIKDAKNLHIRERYLNLVRPIGIDNYDILLPSSPDQKSVKRVESFLTDQNIKPDDMLIGINPVTGFQAKYWYNDRWARVADYLIEEKGAKLIITFGHEPGQEETAMDIIRLMKQKAILSFKTSLLEFTALIKRLKLFICLDSGPFHLAVSQGIPTISLWGRGNLKQWGPPDSGAHLIVRKDVPCSPCDHFECNSMICMKEIKIKDVTEKIDTFLQA